MKAIIIIFTQHYRRYSRPGQTDLLMFAQKRLLELASLPTCACMRVYRIACIFYHVWVYMCFYCTIYKECWALAAFDDIARALALFIMHVYTNNLAHVCPPA